MTRVRHVAWGLTVVLAGLGWMAGRAAGPALARLNYLVRVAERVAAAEAGDLAAAADDYVKAFRSTGMPPATIYEQAEALRARFVRGGGWFGLWCGLVAGLHVAGALAVRRRREYEADPMECVACGRCYIVCPFEKRRTRAAAEPAGDAA